VQRYQKVTGTLASNGKTQPLLGASLRGDKLAFSYLDGDNNLRSARFIVAGDSMHGELGWWSGSKTSVTARKRQP
jgi:hypothetical protein